MIQNRFKVLLAEKELRDGHNWSYREISAATGVSPGTLSQYAQNKVKRFDAVTLDALCGFFECDVGDLLIRITEVSARQWRAETHKSVAITPEE